MDGLSFHSEGERSTPVLGSMVATTSQQASIPSIAVGDRRRVDNKPNSVKLTDLGVPPEDIQPHVLGDGELVVLLSESLQARE